MLGAGGAFFEAADRDRVAAGFHLEGVDLDADEALRVEADFGLELERERDEDAFEPDELDFR